MATFLRYIVLAVVFAPLAQAQTTEPYVIFFDDTVKARFQEMSLDETSGTVTFQNGVFLEASGSSNQQPVLSLPLARIVYQQRVEEWWRGTSRSDSSHRTIEVFLVDDKYQPLKTWEFRRTELESFSMDMFDGKIDNPVVESLKFRIQDAIIK